MWGEILKLEINWNWKLETEDIETETEFKLIKYKLVCWTELSLNVLNEKWLWIRKEICEVGWSFVFLLLRGIEEDIGEFWRENWTFDWLNQIV